MSSIPQNTRIDRSPHELLVFERLKAELGAAFAVPDDAYLALSASEVIARNPARRNE